MRYIPITCQQREAMLRAVGVSEVDDLFSDVPDAARLSRPLSLAAGLSEIEVAAQLKELAASNRAASAMVNFAGAGCYDHHIPSVVDHVVGRPEFFTAYTPYQPEVSQGTLQAMFEYQTMICELTGMDVSNASMYDGATAFAEAALMACRVTGRDKVLVAGSVHPEWMQVLDTYAASGRMDLDVVDFDGGRLDPTDISAAAGEAAAVLVSSPNFLGIFEDLEGIGTAAHEAGALFVVSVNPVLAAIVEPPSVYGADIVVGEGQPLGSPMSFGGPGFGFFACRSEHVRQMPGRVVGRTKDADGDDAYVLTLSTREQHIRREKATSNICSNHALNALAAGVYLSAVGARGLAEIATACVQKAHYLHDRLLATGHFSAAFDEPFGYEFAVRYDGDLDELHHRMLHQGYLAGVVLDPADSDGELLLLAVTEKRTRAEIDSFVEEVVSA